MHWTEFKSKNAIIVGKNRKPKAKLEKTRKPCMTPKLINRIFKCENRKTEPKIGQIRKAENPNAPIIEFEQVQEIPLLDGLIKRQPKN